jgi:hypothetical protein
MRWPPAHALDTGRARPQQRAKPVSPPASNHRTAAQSTCPPGSPPRCSFSPLLFAACVAGPPRAPHAAPHARRCPSAPLAAAGYSLLKTTPRACLTLPALPCVSLKLPASFAARLACLVCRPRPAAEMPAPSGAARPAPLPCLAAPPPCGATVRGATVRGATVRGATVPASPPRGRAGNALEAHPGGPQATPQRPTPHPGPHPRPQPHRPHYSPTDVTDAFVPSHPAPIVEPPRAAQWDARAPPPTRNQQRPRAPRAMPACPPLAAALLCCCVGPDRGARRAPERARCPHIGARQGGLLTGVKARLPHAAREGPLAGPPLPGAPAAPKPMTTLLVRCAAATAQRRPRPRAARRRPSCCLAGGAAAAARRTRGPLR